MIRVLYRHRSGTIINDCPVDQIPAILKDSRSRIWVDVTGEPDETTTGLLEDTFQFEALPDSSQEGFHRQTSFDDMGDYLHITLCDAESVEDDAVRHRASDYYLGASFLVTRHSEPLDVVDTLWDAKEQHDQLITQSCSDVLTELLQPVANAVEPRAAQQESRVEELSDELYSVEELDQRQLLHELQLSKNSTRRLAHELDGLSNVFQQLCRPSTRYVSDDCQVTLRAHSRRLQGLSYTVTELIERLDALMTVSATLSFRSDDDETVRIHTLVVILGLPLLLVALLIVSTLLMAPPAARMWVYAVGWFLFLLFLGGMLFYSRRRGWL